MYAHPAPVWTAYRARTCHVENCSFSKKDSVSMRTFGDLCFEHFIDQWVEQHPIAETTRSEEKVVTAAHRTRFFIQHHYRDLGSLINLLVDVYDLPIYMRHFTTLVIRISPDRQIEDVLQLILGKMKNYHIRICVQSVHRISHPGLFETHNPLGFYYYWNCRSDDVILGSVHYPCPPLGTRWFISDYMDRVRFIDQQTTCPKLDG